MLRTNLNQTRKFFKSESENKSSSTLGKCKAVIKGNDGSNLERHVKQFHDKEYKEFHNKNLSALQPRAGASFSNGPQKTQMCETNQCAIDEMLSKAIRVKMNEKTLENACLQLVTLKGCLIKPMDDSGFRKFQTPCLKVCKPNILSVQKISVRKLGKRQMMSVFAKN